MKKFLIIILALVMLFTSVVTSPLDRFINLFDKEETTKNLTTESPTNTTVTFTIDGAEFHCASNDTWAELVNDDSNELVYGAYIEDGGTIFDAVFRTPIRTANGELVTPSSRIAADSDYYCTTFIFIESSGYRNEISLIGGDDFEGYTDTWGLFADYTGWIIFDPDNPDQFVRTVGSKKYVDANDNILAGVYEYTDEPPETVGDDSGSGDTTEKSDTKTFSICVRYNDETSEYEYETYLTSKDTWEEAIVNGDLPSNYSIENFRDNGYDEDGEGVYNSNGAFFIVDTNGYVEPTANIIDGYTYEMG